MAPESLAILGGLLLVVVLQLVLLLRRPATDPLLVHLQSALDRQAERIAALPAEFERSLAREAAAIGQRVGDGALDQTKALGEGIGRIADRLSVQEKAVLDRLAADAAALTDRLALDAKATREAIVEQRQAVTKALSDHKDDTALLRRDVTQGIAEIRLAFMEGLAKLQEALATENTRGRDLLDAKLKELREGNETRLAEIQKTVNEQLQSAVEKQMTESFQRVIDQFNAIQAMMGNVQSVATQVGDLKRLFANVKTRGGWGETQVKAALDDFLPEGSYQTNVKLHEGSNDLVEFAIRMPVAGDTPVYLPVDAKFPVEDYERILAAHDAGDGDGETAARKALGVRLRAEAAKIQAKYIHPPQTTEFAVMYLPTEGLYAELARMPGVIDDIGRRNRVFVAGPSLLPAMLRTIQLGHVTLALSKNADSVRELLAATKAEMGKMDTVLERLGKQVGTVSNTIGDARTRTRVIATKLKSVEAMPGDQAAELLGIGNGMLEVEDEP